MTIADQYPVSSETLANQERVEMAALYGVAGQLGNLAKGDRSEAVLTQLSANLDVLAGENPKILNSDWLEAQEESLGDFWIPSDYGLAGAAAAEFIANCSLRDASMRGQMRTEENLVDYAKSLSRCGVFRTHAGAIGSLVRSIDLHGCGANGYVQFDDHAASFASGITHSMRARYWQ